MHALPNRRSAVSAAFALTLCVSSLLMTSTPAHAIKSGSIGSGKYSIGHFWENAGKSGALIAVYQPDQCTVTTSDVDYGVEWLPSGWDNKTSGIEDNYKCDTKLYDGKSYTGASWPSSGYYNFASTGGVPSGWNDRMSSAKFS